MKYMYFDLWNVKCEIFGNVIVISIENSIRYCGIWKIVSAQGVITILINYIYNYDIGARPSLGMHPLFIYIKVGDIVSLHPWFATHVIFMESSWFDFILYTDYDKQMQGKIY